MEPRIGILLHLNLCLAEALMGVPSGANSRPPCASKLCGPVPKYEFPEEEGGEGFLDWLAFQHIRWIEFCVLQVLVYHASGCTMRIWKTCKKLGPRASSWAPTVSCFHLFLGVWNSWWSTRPRLYVLCQKCERVEVSTNWKIFHESVSFGFRDILKFVVDVVVLL